MKFQFISKTRSILALFILGASALTADAQIGVSVHVGVRPPPVRYERAPEYRPGHVWAPGYWGWNGNAHVWYGGHWEGERPGYRYVPAAWVLVDGEWVFNAAYWQPYAPAVIVQPAPVVVQQAPPQYIQQSPSAPPGLDPRFWYYCQDPAGYYPYVQNCSIAWQPVTPTAR
ncbi:MAG TPA: YXWGXW repeat-containing protein [Burkholderiaceae bacterium]|nr:YXWGXW repeat-containing protein [Burkholderiaceae bacterium]